MVEVGGYVTVAIDGRVRVLVDWALVLGVGRVEVGGSLVGAGPVYILLALLS